MTRTDHASGPADSSRAQRTGMILALTAVVRIVVAHHALATYGSSWFFLRGTEMGYLAQSMLEGKGFSSPFGVPTGPTAMICPGYPLIVAGVFRALGSYSGLSAIVLITLNIALNVLCTWWILILGRRFATARAADCVATFWALSPPLLWMPTIFWDTSLSTASILGVVVFATGSSRQTRLGRWFCLGGACGFLGLINPALLPCLLVIPGFKAIRETQRWKKYGCFLCACAFLFAPWPIRNAKVFHAWIPARTTMGLELWMGNRPGGEGFLDKSVFPTYNPVELGEYRRLGELAFMQQKQHLAFAGIQTSRLAFVELTFKRIVRFWTGSGSRPGVWAYSLHACFTSALGFWGLLRSLRRRSASLRFPMFAAFFLFPLPYYVTHAEFRYRLVLDPLLIALAALPIEAALPRVPRPREHDPARNL